MSKILIVDDDPHIRELCSVFLHDAGFETLEAKDGADAKPAQKQTVDTCQE